MRAAGRFLRTNDYTELQSFLAGDTILEFEWDGVHWTGPSDWGNPPGPPFPPGKYTLEVSAIGTVDGQDFTVSNTYKLMLIDLP